MFQDEVNEVSNGFGREMRLICPNCDAQYEVPDEVMPTSGRDVQCSNCGQTWFQHHPDHIPAEDPDDIYDASPDVDEEAASPPPPQVAAPAVRKQLDPSVADILRQEAEAEQEARRRRQADTLESQPDLGLEGTDEPDEDRRARQAKSRMARLRGEPERKEATATAAAVGSRRDLLPDIEEINSTLRSGSDRRSVDPVLPRHDAEPTKADSERRGFRIGFLGIVVLTVLLILLYVFAAQIAAVVPQVDPYLSSYVAWVDGLRLSLDATLKNALQWLDAKASQSGS